MLIGLLGDSLATLATVTAAQPRDHAWLGVVIALVMVLAIAVVSCMNPKRGHRD